MFSFQVQGSFTETYNLENLVWVWDAQKPIKIPSLFITFFKMIAPHSVSDLGGEKPFVQSYAITASSLVQTWEGNLPSFVSNLHEDISHILPPTLFMKSHKRLFMDDENAAVSNRRKLYVNEDNRTVTTIPPDVTIGTYISCTLF